jgi:hypothetical protein
MKKTLREYLEKKESTIGLFGAALSVIMFVSLLEICLSNMRGETNIIIQPIATAINCLCWVLYGFSKRDNFIMLPNML